MRVARPSVRDLGKPATGGALRVGLGLIFACACGAPGERESADSYGIISSAAPTLGAGADTTGTDASASDSSSTGMSGGSSGDESETDTSGGALTGGLLEDDAEIVTAPLPSAMSCEESGEYAVTVRNTGTTTWSRAGGYKLGALDDEDPLHAGERVYLPEGVYVAPGQTHTFSLELSAPADAGVYTTDWRMVREGVQWFGEELAQDVTVSCDPVGPPPLDLSDVIWLHQDVSGWPVTMTLESVTFEGGNICMNHGGPDEGVFVWPQKALNGEVWVVGNPWVFIFRDGDWYGATWEWLRPDQTCKAVTSVAGDHIKQAPFDANSGWTPSSGETLYFMVSSLARLPGFDNVQERSEPLLVVWP